MLHLILGGAALQRCGNCIVLSAALAAEATLSAQERVFPQPARHIWMEEPYRKHFTFFLVAVATMAGLVALIAPAPGRADGQPARSLPRPLIRIYY